MIELQRTNTSSWEHMAKEPTLDVKQRPGKVSWGGHISAELGRERRVCPSDGRLNADPGPPGNMEM